MAAYLFTKIKNNINKIEGATGLSPYSITYNIDGTIRIFFESMLSTDEEGSLDLFMSDCGFESSDKKELSHSSKLIVGKEIAITNEWTSLGGVVEAPERFKVDLSRIYIKISGAYLSNGSTVEFKLIENDFSGRERDLNKNLFIVEDTINQWKPFEFVTDIDFASGKFLYNLLGKCGNGSGMIQFTSIDFIEDLDKYSTEENQAELDSLDEELSMLGG